MEGEVELLSTGYCITSLVDGEERCRLFYKEMRYLVEKKLMAEVGMIQEVFVSLGI
jgi:hypothetical protein